MKLRFHTRDVFTTRKFAGNPLAVVLAADHLASVKRKLADLRRLEKALKSMASECSQGEVPYCPIIDELFKIS